VEMFLDMFNAMDKGVQPMETFYDGYVVNCIIDASYKAAQTKKWEPVQIEAWRGEEVHQQETGLKDYDEGHLLIKEEKMPDGKTKIILKDKQTGRISQKIQ